MKQGTTTSRVYTYIQDYIDRHHYAPSYVEVMTACHLASRSVAEYHIARLVQAGWITRAPGKARSIVLVPRGEVQ